MRCVGAQILLVFWQIGLEFAAIASFHKKKAVICNKSCMGTFLGFALTLHNTEQNVFFLVGVSQRPQVPREPTPNNLRANSERTPNELRASSEQTPNKRTSSERTLSLVDFRTNPRANSEHTLANMHVLSLSILVVKLFFLPFFGLTKRGQVITGASFNKWPGKAFRAGFVGLQRPG